MSDGGWPRLWMEALQLKVAEQGHRSDGLGGGSTSLNGHYIVYRYDKKNTSYRNSFLDYVRLRLYFSHI